MAYMRDITGRRLDEFEVADIEYTVAIPGQRVACQPLTAPNASSTTANLDLVQRTMFKLPFRAVRWRIGFRNANLRSADGSAALNTPCSITGVWTGAPVRPTTTTSGNRWVGNCTAALTQRSTALTVPTDGSRVWSAWVEDDDFEANVEKVISWGLTTTTGTGVAQGNAFQGVSAAGASNAANATLTGPTVGTNVLRLDVVLEYEMVEPIKVMLFVGDSNTAHYVPDAAPTMPGAAAGALPHESWPHVAGAMGGFCAVNLGVGSTTTQEWNTGYAKLWDRLPAGIDPDGALVSLGTNGISSLGSFVTSFQGVNTYLRSTLGLSTLWWTTITPRAFPDGAYTAGGTKIVGRLAADAAAGATTLSSSLSIASGTLGVGTGQNMEDVTVSGVSGSGPYTLTVSALANAHYVGERLHTGDERVRTFINNFLRQNPDGITGCFDFEKVVESEPGSFRMDDRYAATDWLHRQRSAALPLAALVVGSGVQPLFA